MNAVHENQPLPQIGTACHGGFFTDLILIDGRTHLIITAPKADGEHADVRWHKNLKRVPGALSYYDSYANTVAMAEAGSPAAQWARSQRIGGFDDWSIAARDVLERQYFRLKPSRASNYCYYRSGENPSAIPPAYPYTESLPAQTAIELFKAGAAEAFDEVGYWSSTQYEADSGCAWAQDFGHGLQNLYRKDNEFRVRLVRLIQI